MEVLLETPPAEEGGEPEQRPLFHGLTDEHGIASVSMRKLGEDPESGLEVTVRIDGFEETFAGRVRSVSHDAVFTPYYALTERDRSRLSYLAEVELLDPKARDLPTGIPVEVVLGSGSATEASGDE